MRVVDAWCEDAGGARIASQQQGERCHACMEVEFTAEVQDPWFAFSFLNEAQQTCYVASSTVHGNTGTFRAGERAVLAFGFDNWLGASRYSLMLTSAVPALEDGGLTQIPDAASLIVTAPHWSGAAADLPHDLTLRRL